MTVADMELIIGANADEAIAAFKKLGYTITQTEKQAGKFTQKAGKDFTALGQVLQDLPFGFIAIQNNITRLLPAAGGLGLAISAITAAITFAQIGFSNWTRGFRKSKEEVDEFAKGLNSAKAGAIETGVKLQAFVNIARDNTKSLAERNFALVEANKLMGEHGQKLTLVNINTKTATEEINNFTQALISQAVANKFADKVADLIIKQTQAAADYGKAVEKFNTTTKDAIRTNKQFSNNLNPTGASLGNLFTLIEDGASVYEGTFVAAEKYKDITADLRETTDLYNQTLSKSVGLFGKLGTKIPETTDKAKKAVKELFINANITNAKNTGIVFYSNIIGNAQDVLDKNPLQFKFAPLDTAAAEKLLADTKKLADIVQSTLINSLASIGESLGNVLAGAKNPFAPVFAVLSEGLKNLGKAYIQIGVEALIAQRALKLLMTSPYLTIAAGIAFVALGQLLQAKANNVKAFATGGVVTKPTLALMGEQGPERITPLGYEGRANNIMQGEVIFQISGQNLRGILKRADQTAFNTF